MPEKLSIDFDQPIPLFAMQQCVLLPHATMPLQLFEDQYNQMIQDALSSHHLIAMGLFAQEDGGQEPIGSPPVRPYVCVGYILRHERLGGKRVNLLLQGLCRARIHRQVTDTPYRAVMLEPTEPRQPMEIDMEEHRRRIESLLFDPHLKQLTVIQSINNWVNAEIPTVALVDLAIMTICFDAPQRYAMLVEANGFKRSTWLEGLLQDTRRTLITAERFRPHPSADHTFLN